MIPLKTNSDTTDISPKYAVKFILLFGIISLFADMTYEGARSITGPYLALLGATGTVVGIVAGLGELLGYALRLVSGYLVEKTERYWLITFIGYFINLLAVPLLALAGSWQMAAVLIVLERVGKAIRNPARDTMLSHASQRIGSGMGFGIHEAMDKIGAMSGPLIIAAALYFNLGYPLSFAILAIPALMAISVLIGTSRLYPHPQHLEVKRPEFAGHGIPPIFWLYTIASALVAAAFADFALIAFHFAKAGSFSGAWIPVVYAFAMGTTALTSIIFGKLYDKHGFSILILLVILSAGFAPLVFLGHSLWVIYLGMLLWGLGVGSQESLMRAVIANMIPSHKRGSAYGIFNAFYGVSWFLGSVIIGWLYDKNIVSVVSFSVTLQIIAVIMLIIVAFKIKTS
ncbi:MAG: MFS transporter [Coxiellaceae bacterium]|nr:MAG: MFS transporter [Coxiellaceae bacterium]